jgi:hypothetical protein
MSGIVFESGLPLNRRILFELAFPFYAMNRSASVEFAPVPRLDRFEGGNEIGCRGKI